MTKDFSTQRVPNVHEVLRVSTASSSGSQETLWRRFGRFFNCHETDLAAILEVPFVCLALPEKATEAIEGVAFAHLPLVLKTGPWTRGPLLFAKLEPDQLQINRT